MTGLGFRRGENWGLGPRSLGLGGQDLRLKIRRANGSLGEPVGRNKKEGWETHGHAHLGDKGPDVVFHWILSVTRVAFAFVLPCCLLA